IRARVEHPFSAVAGGLFSMIYNTPFGQVLRGTPDATNPSAGSPFGWYYLPTGAGGAEISVADEDSNRAATRAYGYTMAPEAKRRNIPENSPVACTGAPRECDQPFSATLTQLAAAVPLNDGRTLSQVFQSNYTEGNNVLVSDDRANDDEGTNGIRGYDPARLFTDDYYTFANNYEFGGQDPVCNNPSGVGPCTPVVNVEGRVTFPETPNADVFPGTLSLFYYNNILHDYFYELGFTEALFNFQQDNFGRGGVGRDGVLAEVQDGSGTDNANMNPQPDGTHPRMQMYLFTEGGTRRADGSFDFDVVAHELMHAINNRAVGKGDINCVGNGLVGESGGQGEGWGDYLAFSMADDDIIGEYVTGEFDVGIRRLPATNYRWSYASLNGQGLTRRDSHYINNPLLAPPDPDPGAIPFETHDGGEVWSTILWDMRELLIMKDPNGVFFDGTRRLDTGIIPTGTEFYIGPRKVRSVDNQHPIEYRNILRNPNFNTTTDSTGTTDGTIPNIVPAKHIVRPGLVAAEIQARGNRTGPLATAVSTGARLADNLMLRGMQLSVCGPTFVESRDAILAADRELTGGENRAIIWRAFASHGVGVMAMSSSTRGEGLVIGVGGTGTVVEDFSVPAGVTACEQNGPLAAPDFALTNTLPNTVTITIQPHGGAARFIISRAEKATGPYAVVADVAPNPVTPTIYNDNNGGQGLVRDK
ncbi:MAG TPA: M36 family metallopeptidase, partial [Pyrinomonadaceae bacterium]|nr:M36 family metallopeptidase [Pyrinomonadaceae bacterium]